VQQRLEQYRQWDTQSAKRRQETLEFQQRRKREQYAQRWKCYGNQEVDTSLWRQQVDGTWVTYLKVTPGGDTCSGLTDSDAQVLPGDSLAKIAIRYGMSIGELLRLNPVLQASRLEVGTRIRVPDPSSAQSRIPLGVVSIPKRFDQSLFELVKQGIVSPSDRELQYLYPWSQGTPDSLIGVSCKSLMINRKQAYKDWGVWFRPVAGSPDEQLVVDRCAAKDEHQKSH